MKYIIKFSIAAVFLICISSCEKGLEDLNRNKVSPTTLEPALLLNQAIVYSSYPFKTLVFDMGIVQQLVSPNGGVLAGANFNQDSRDATTQPVWAVYYQNVIKYTHDAIVKVKDIPARSNLYNMARIYQAFTFMILTDEYGDIPYSQGGAGFTDQIFFPVYDKQQTIYNDIIKELTEASAALNTTSTIETSDLLYAGNIARWKKFANSLLLRAGMRLIKVDAAKAQSVVTAAITAGVITSNADNAYIRHDANFTHPIGAGLNGSEAANFYLTKPFIDQLSTIHSIYNADNKTAYTGDMGAFNYLIRTKYNDRLIHGSPINTVFKTNTYNDVCWFKHK